MLHVFGMFWFISPKDLLVSLLMEGKSTDARPRLARAKLRHSLTRRRCGGTCSLGIRRVIEQM